MIIRAFSMKDIRLYAVVASFFVIEALRFYAYVFDPTFLFILVVSTSFCIGIHLISHKMVSRYFGLDTSIRFSIPGLILSLVAATPWSPLRIAVVGDIVVTDGAVVPRTKALVAMAGPVGNIVQMLIFLFLTYISPVFIFGVMVNIDLVVSQLFPISFLDGKAVFDWSKRVWIALFLVSYFMWLLCYVF